MDEMRDDLILINYHHGPSSDPWYDSSVYDVRESFYFSGSYGVPTVFIDGGGDYSDATLVVVGAGSAASAYAEYKGKLQLSTDPTSNLVVDISGDLRPSTASVTVSVTASNPVTETNLYVRTILYEDALYYPQNNGPPFHRTVARALNEQALGSISQGQTVTKQVTLLVNSGWRADKLGVAAFVQSGTTKTVSGGFKIADILNAAKSDFVPRGIMVHADAGTVADYAEGYEVLAAERGLHFDTWNALTALDTGTVDERGVPTALNPAEAPLIVWYTRAESSGVLSLPERELLGGYLDGGGNLLITGSNIGYDAYTNYRTWSQQYLHGTFSGDESATTKVRGVSGDPIGNAFSGFDLDILAGADRIAPVVQPGTGAPFQYRPNTYASVRSQHDTDSRVVYLGFEYFEGTHAYRGDVMNSIVSWIDGASAPMVDVLYPDGGEKFAQGAAITIRWHANDVLMPEDAIDIYFSSDGGGNWQQIALGEPNDGQYAWTVPSLDSAQCRIRIVARDMSTESGDGVAMSDSNFICGEPGFVLTFTGADLGWRLVSFPTILADTSASVVLASMSGKYRMVRAFDPRSADPWMEYDPTRTSGASLFIDNTMAFWIDVTGPGSLTLQGGKPTGMQYVPLKAGWNLVGFPSYRTDYTVAMLKADTGATRVEGFDPSNIEYRLRLMGGADLLVTGQGYWVFAPADTVWQVPT